MTDLNASILGGTYGRAADASARVQFRRGMTLTAMTLLMPGSAQLVMGNKAVGRLAIRVWLGFLAAGALLVVLAMTSRTGLFSLLTDGRVLTLVRWVLVAGAVAWVALLIDAWRLARPRQMARGHRLWMTGLNGVLCFVTAGTLLFGAHLVSVQNGFIGSVFASKTTSDPVDGRYNILLLGADSGKDRSGLRPDSLTVASVDRETGRTVLIGLPRNLENVPFPKGSPMREEFPDGFDCEGCYLNAVNTWANDHADLFGDVDEPGIEATMEAAGEITGLNINYYAMVNMKGFSRLIDAVGGVEIDVKERTAIGGIGSPIRGYIEVGEQKLTGDEALWYSRSRVENDDWSRMGRQKCVMNAMLQQLSPQKVLMNVQAIADSGKTLLETDIPAKDLDVMMDLALKARHQKISSVSLVPPVVYTGNPDFDKVRSLVADEIAEAEGTAKPTSGITVASLKVPDLSADEDADDPRKDNQSDDLAATC